MKWRKPDDYPKETGEQLCEVIRKKFGETTIYPTYVKFIAGENYWLSSPVGYGIHRWLDESIPPEKTYSEEERDVFACAFLVFALFDPRAQGLVQANTPVGKILDFYKDRSFIDPDTSKQ